MSLEGTSIEESWVLVSRRSRAEESRMRRWLFLFLSQLLILPQPWKHCSRSTHPPSFFVSPIPNRLFVTSAYSRQFSYSVIDPRSSEMILPSIKRSFIRSNSTLVRSRSRGMQIEFLAAVFSASPSPPFWSNVVPLVTTRS